MKTQPAINPTASIRSLPARHPAEPVGGSAAMHALRRGAVNAAGFDMPVLLTGETGVGKEVMARYVHAHSARAKGPLVTVNCGALRADRILSDLFGHVKGAYTGAARDRTGAFSRATGGVLFLDEIGELPLEAQPFLLRALQERVYTPMGSDAPKSCDIRLIAATNRDLRARVATGHFRADLLHRIDVLTLPVPPLRERPDDIPDLVLHFLARLNAEYGRGCLPPRAADLTRLRGLPLRGNARELHNLVRRAFVHATGPRLEFSDELLFPHSSDSEAIGFLTLEAAQRRHVIAALRATGGKVSGKTGAAKLLGMKRTTLLSLLSLLDRLGVEVREYQ